MAAIAVLLLGTVGIAGEKRRPKPGKPASARLTAVLPASDAVAVFDSKRFFTDALPKILASNQPMLAEVLSKMAEMENRTGIDLRKFDQVAVGIAINRISPTNIDFDPVAIANGDINSGALIAVAKLASKGAYTEEKIGERTLYVFNAKNVLDKTAVTVHNSKLNKIIEKGLGGLMKDVAVAALDEKTLVLGSAKRVRETLAGTTRVSPEITSLLSAKVNAVMSFGLKSFAGMAVLLPFDNDALGEAVDSIQYMSGSIELNAGLTSLHMTAKTAKPEFANRLKDTLAGLQAFGNVAFANPKRPDQQVYGRLVKAATFTTRGNDVVFDLAVPQSDIDILIAKVK